ncbi:MAG: hypothetical protein GF313_17575 [Caldithrix sp.]|nr:hypothetical protein [Caldithrix sp.]
MAELSDATIKQYTEAAYGYDLLGHKVNTGIYGPGKPVFGGAFLNYRYRYNAFKMTAGLRYHYFDRDVKYLDDRFAATVYCRIYNVFNTKNVINVYPLTGQADDDGFLSGKMDPNQLETFYNIYGGEDYLKMYRAINLQNGQAYWDRLGKQIYGRPRQIFLGIRFAY